MDPIEKSITNLKQLATKINRASDATQNALAHYERLLQQTGIGISVWVGVIEQAPLITKSGEAAGLSGLRIGWTKVGDDWRIAAQPVEARFDAGMRDHLDEEGLPDLSGWHEIVWNDFEDSEGNRHFETIPASPVANASRSVRFQALAMVSRIVEELTKEAKTAAASADEVSKLISIDEWARQGERAPGKNSSDDIPF